MNLVLERKEYLVGVTIYEARNIDGKDAQGTSDPFLKIKCADQIQQTQKKYEQNSAVWNQSLTFTSVKMNQYELETFELILELYDHNPIFTNELIGQYSIGLSSLYRALNHEFYKIWVGLFHPDDHNKTVGYLQISCFIVGPNERPPVHASEDEVPDDADQDSEQDEEEIVKQIESIKRAQGVVLVNTANIINKTYQLTAVITKTENLPNFGGEVNPFISMRVNGCVLTTKTLSKNNNPQFNNRLQFPITQPILNDKITSRIWSKTGGFTPDIFIANIPEHPQQGDFFNLSKLQSSDGRMAARWINLYGIPPDERSQKTRSLREGTCFLGRVLLAMNLSANEFPNLGSSTSGPLKEPKQANYQLWVDLYEWIHCDYANKSSQFFVEVTIGQEKVQNMSKAKFNKSSKTLTFKEKIVDTMNLNFPMDISQVPDIIINFKQKSSSGSLTRIGFLRIVASDVCCKSPKPQWMRIKNNINDSSGKHPGEILMNCQLIRYNPNMDSPERILRQRSGKQNYQFHYQIFSGFEIAGAIDKEKLKTRVQLQIGQSIEEKEKEKEQDKIKIIQTDFVEGRFPVWKKFGNETILLDKELGLESDMKISVQNEFNGKTSFIGGCSVPIQNSITKLCERPQFYNLINDEGMFVGQILANFYIKFYAVDLKKNPEQKEVENIPAHQEIIQKLEEVTSKLEYPVDISFSLLGVRNLINKAQKPVVTVKLINCLADKDEKFQKEQKFDLTESEDGSNASFDPRNPNFWQIVKFKNVILTKEPLTWPFLEITVEEKDNDEQKSVFKNMIKRGCETCFSTICLIPYADQSILDDEDKNYAMMQLERNQDELSYVQPQIQLELYKKNGLNLNYNKLIQGNDEDDESQNNVEETVPFKLNDLRKSHYDEVQKKTINKGKTRQTQTYDIYKMLEKGRNLNQTLDAEDYDLEINKSLRQRDEFGINIDDEEYDNEDEDQDLLGNAHQEQRDPQDIGIICNPQHLINFEVNKADKEKEEEEREKEKESLRRDIQEFTKKLNKIDEDQIDYKRILQMKIMELQDDIQNLDEEKMTEQKFWGMAGLNDDDEFDYGRDIIRDATYEKMMLLPYRHIPLFTKGDWFQNFSNDELVSVSGILRSGKLSGANLKANVQIVKKEHNEDAIANFGQPQKKNDGGVNQRIGEETEQQGDQQANQFEFDPKYCESLDENKMNEICQININSGDKNQKVKNLMEESNLLIPFDISNFLFMKAISHDLQKKYKLRVYIISGQNLSAMNNIIDLKSKWAGMNALCTANPYLVIKVGEQTKEKKSKKCKEIIDREKAVHNELNPEFLVNYEFDVEFPHDNFLEIAIYDKQNIKIRDQLIGKTIVDLEDRRNSDLLNQNRMTVLVQNEIIKKSQRHLKEKKNKEYEQQLKQRKDQINKLNQLYKQVDQIMVPIEFRELYHPSKQQVQGILECWVEIITEEDSRRIPFSKMKQQQAQTYEIRVIIWETRNIPLTDGDNVDQFVRCTFDPTGWSEDEVTKSTDTHMNSKDGRGQFNWRMKFDLKVPCEFPRLKFQVMDAGVYQDEAIGETTMSLKNTLKKLKKEGQVSVPKSFVSFINPTDPDEERGMMLFSMDILLKEDAKQDPVGEAQEEPNKNPYLKKPIAGRGLGDALSAIGLGVPRISFNPFGKFLPFVIAAFVIVSLLTIKVMFL